MCYCMVQLLDACTSRLDLNSAARRLFTLDGDEVCNFFVYRRFPLVRTGRPDGHFVNGVRHF